MIVGEWEGVSEGGKRRWRDTGRGTEVRVEEGKRRWRDTGRGREVRGGMGRERDREGEKYKCNGVTQYLNQVE